MAHATEHSERVSSAHLSDEDRRIIRQTLWSHAGDYSADDLIRAYLMGKKKGAEEKEAESAKTEELSPEDQQLRAHLGHALDEAERFYLDIRSSHEINPVAAFLRVNSFWPFAAETLYLVPSDEFISDAVLEVYRAAANRSGELRCRDEDYSKCFDLVFRLMPMKDSTDLDAIHTDFAFRYERKPESTP